MAIKENVQAALEAGVEPISLRYKPVYSCSSKKPIAICSRMLLNSTVLGELTPEQYEVVADRTVRSEKLALWGITYAQRIVQKLGSTGVDLSFISVRCPVRAAKAAFARSLERLMLKYDFKSCEKLCLEFPISILFEQEGEVNAALNELKKSGVQTMISGFGEEFCPTMRLSSISFDYVLLHPQQSEKLKHPSSAQTAVSLISFIKNNGAKVIVPDIDNERALVEMQREDCIGYLPKTPFMTYDQLLQTIKEEKSGGGD